MSETPSQSLPQPLLTRTRVLDLVPFGTPTAETGFYALRLPCPGWEKWSPGQFLMLRRVNGNSDAPWARPFAICRYAKHSLVVFFQVNGRVTRQMARLKPDDEVELWGPLGNAMAMEPENETLLIAGGIGIAPFVSYVQEHPAAWNISMIFGHSTPLKNYPFDSLNEKIIADSFYDKNPGDTEKFAQLIDQRIQEHVETTKGKGLILSCGPTPMLKRVQETSLKFKARTQISLETRMACGIGACLGCVVKAIPDSGEVRLPRYVQTCTCGPNFWANAVTL